jgi:hypothetical protein
LRKPEGGAPGVGAGLHSNAEFFKDPPQHLRRRFVCAHQ